MYSTGRYRVSVSGFHQSSFDKVLILLLAYIHLLISSMCVRMCVRVCVRACVCVSLQKNTKTNVTAMCLYRISWERHHPVQYWSMKDAETKAVPPQGLNCRPGPCEGVAGAMSASRVVCKVVQFTVKQRQLHASPPANELSWLLEPKFLATPAICSSQSRVELNLSRHRRFEV